MRLLQIVSRDSDADLIADHLQIASVVMLTFVLTGGYFVQSIPPWISWMKYAALMTSSHRCMQTHTHTHPTHASPVRTHTCTLGYRV